MNENVVLDKILIDADNQAEQIIENTNKEILNMKKEVQDYETSLNEKLNLEVDKYKKENEEFYVSTLEFTKSKVYLKIKNEVLSDLKKTALSRIKNYKNAEMIEFLNKILIENAENDETVLINIDGINKSDLEKLDIVKSRNLKLVEDKKIGEGLVLTTETYDKNLSFESIINDMFDRKRNEICKVLF